MCALTRLWALAMSSGISLGSPGHGVQTAMGTVIESPNCAKAPGVPLKRAWTFFIASAQAAPVGASPAVDSPRASTEAPETVALADASPARGASGLQPPAASMAYK